MSKYKDMFFDPQKRREKIKAEKKAALQREFTDRYQIMEYNGHEYLAVNGKPTIEAKLVCGGLIEALQAAREATVNYLMER